MKMTATIEVPESASWQDIEDAKLSATWKTVKDRKDIIRETDLCDKCGSCKFFEPTPCKRNKTYGVCHKGHVSPRSRSIKKCVLYERTKQ